MDETVQTPIGEATPAPAAPETPAAPQTPPDPKQLTDVVKHAFSKPSRRGEHAVTQPRRDTGQFAGPPAAQPAALPTPAAPARPAMPKSLKQDLAPFWDKTPAELASAIIEREAAYEKGVEPLKLKAREAEALLNEFRPYEHLMRAANATPQQAIRNYLQTAAVFQQGSPQQKAQAVRALMGQYGISLEDLQTVTGSSSGNAPPQPVHDPQVWELRQQVQHLTAAQQQEREARAMAALQQFAADPKHKHLDAVSSQMEVLLRNPDLLGSGVEVLSETERLERAYEQAIWSNPEVRAKVLEEQAAAKAAEDKAAHDQRVAQARNAAVQVTGAPATGPAPKVDPKDLNAVVRSALQAQR